MNKINTGNSHFEPESLAMRLAGFLGLAKLRWSLRRLHVPVSKDALVLEVGSGGNPYPRANILLDAYEDSRERHWDPLVHDRPTILAFGEKLPFKDKVFDFVIAAHVLEHTPYPEQFLSELQRVGKAGYIETPDAFMERINPYKDHRLEVTLRRGTLIIRKKHYWLEDNDIVDLYEHRVKKIITSRTIPDHAEEFHVRYFWKEKIDYVITNPEINANWTPPDTNINYKSMSKEGLMKSLRFTVLNIIRKLFSQTRRNRKLNIFPLLQCNKCESSTLEVTKNNEIICSECKSIYHVKDNIFIFK
jgi:SAM-dependent methyltransferase